MLHCSIPTTNDSDSLKEKAINLILDKKIEFRFENLKEIFIKKVDGVVMLIPKSDKSVCTNFGAKVQFSTLRLNNISK